MKLALISHGRVNPNGNNGIARTMYNLNLHLNGIGLETHLLCFDDRQKDYGIFMRDANTTVHLFPRERYFGGSMMADFISDNHFDLLHIHLPWMLDKCELLRNLGGRVPYIVTSHGAYAFRLLSLKKKLSLRWLEGRFLREAKILHALCPEEKCDLRAHGLKNLMEVIPNGLNDGEFGRFDAACHRDADPYDHDFVNIVLVARLRPDKNVIGMIRMLDYLSPEILKKIRIHLVGDGVEPYLSTIRTAAKKHPDNVIFHGPKYDEEKYAFICKADIYVQPSFCEGISFSILDAMAAGKAMILSRQTNMTHYYNRNFYRMTETYPEDIAAAVEELVGNRELRIELGQNAGKVARSIFAWKNLVGDYVKMYERALTQK